jgi:hypothetical protein
MKQLTKSFGIKAFFSTLVLALYQLVAMAQDAPKVEVNGNDVGTWIGQNWIWIVGIIVLLIIILLASSGRSRSSKSTTVRRDIDGRTTTVTSVRDE